MTSKVLYISDLRTEAIHLKSGNKILTDAPVDNNGKGSFFSPTDLLATSLASCMLTIIGISAKNHNFNIDGAYAEVTKIMAETPRRVIQIDVVLNFLTNSYTEKEKKFIESAALTCPVSKSLNPEIYQNITFKYL